MGENRGRIVFRNAYEHAAINTCGRLVEVAYEGVTD
jgi:hypothetical protein